MERASATKAASSLLLASEMVSAQASVLSQDLNLIYFSEILRYKETIFPPSSQPTTLSTVITTNASPLPKGTDVGQPKIQSKAAPMSKIPFALYNNSVSLVLASMGSVLMLALFDWQLPPFPFM